MPELEPSEGETRSGENAPVDKFAAECRERCGGRTQGHSDDVRCGDSFTYEGESAYAFCPSHMQVVLGDD